MEHTFLLLAFFHAPRTFDNQQVLCHWKIGQQLLPS